MPPHTWRWLGVYAASVLAGLLIFLSWLGPCPPTARADGPWLNDAASSYVRRSMWDSGYWPEHDGYIGRATPWSWE